MTQYEITITVEHSDILIIEADDDGAARRIAIEMAEKQYPGSEPWVDRCRLTSGYVPDNDPAAPPSDNRAEGR